MAILEKTAPRYLPPRLSHHDLALHQARHDEGLKDGIPTCLQALSNRLFAATESGALAFTVPDVPGKPHWKELRTPRVIHRSDYAVWLETIGEPPPVWWRCEGDPIDAPASSGSPNPAGARKNFWREVIIAAAAELKADTGRAGTPSQIWTRLIHKPPRGYRYSVAADERELKNPDAAPLTLEKCLRRCRRYDRPDLIDNH